MANKTPSPRDIRRLRQLNAKLDQAIEFRQQDEDSTVKKAAVIGGLGAAAYGAGSILRGRAWQKKVTGAVDNSPSGLVGALKTGHSMNSIAVRGAVTGAKAQTSAFVQGAKEKAAVGATKAYSGFNKGVDTVSKAMDPAINASRKAVSSGADALKKLRLKIANR